VWGGGGGGGATVCLFGCAGKNEMQENLNKPFLGVIDTSGQYIY
jgi:hypothetical protein